MERKEPYATEEEFNRRVIRYRDIPLAELVPGSNSHIVSTERMTVSFLTMAPNSSFEVHRHESEQIMIVIGGACDEVIEGKLYHLEEGDVVILPANIEHGGYISERGCRAIDVFCPPRQDYVAKLEAAKKGSPR
jgi:gluconolactonase